MLLRGKIWGYPPLASPVFLSPWWPVALESSLFPQARNDSERSYSANWTNTNNLISKIFGRKKKCPKIVSSEQKHTPSEHFRLCIVQVNVQIAAILRVFLQQGRFMKTLNSVTPFARITNLRHCELWNLLEQHRRLSHFWRI